MQGALPWVVVPIYVARATMRWELGAYVYSQWPANYDMCSSQDVMVKPWQRGGALLLITDHNVSTYIQ